MGEHIALLLMAYGSPDRLEEVDAYLADIRGGRPTPAALVEELRERYRRVGVPTPLRRVTEELAQRLEATLGRSGAEPLSVHVGMKHWTPRIGAAVQDIVTAGATRLIAIVVAPHYSRISIGGYRAQVERALSHAPRQLPLDFVEDWHDLPGYLDALAQNVRVAMAQFPNPADPVVVFTAHSLPARILEEGDPYRDRLLASSSAVAERAGVRRWEFSFQSQSQTGEPWLGPDLVETIDNLHHRGVRQVLVAPVGFVADHLEIAFDIDIEAREHAGGLGMDLRRTAMLNADPRLVAALAALVTQRLQGATSVRRAGPA